MNRSVGVGKCSGLSGDLELNNLSRYAFGPTSPGFRFS